MRIRENNTSALSENHYAVCLSVVVVFFYNFRKAVTTEADVCWPACPPADVSRRRFLPVHQRAPSWLTHANIGLGNPRALPKLRRLCFPGAFRNGLVPLDPLMSLPPRSSRPLPPLKLPSLLPCSQKTHPLPWVLYPPPPPSPYSRQRAMALKRISRSRPSSGLPSLLCVGGLLVQNPPYVRRSRTGCSRQALAPAAPTTLCSAPALEQHQLPVRSLQAPARSEPCE